MILALAALGTAQADEADELAKYDERVLRADGVGTNGADVLALFRKRTLSAEDLAGIPKLIRQLGDNEFDRREEATRKLASFGPPVVLLLQPATKDEDAEISRRSREIVAAIRAQGTAVPMAAARHVARTRPAGAVPVLVQYLPFADDAAVVGEVMDALVALTPRAEDADVALKDAMKDPLALKRAAGAYVLGRARDDARRGEVRKLLADMDATVRFRAALGLLAGRDKAGVAPLIDLASGTHGDLTWQAEDLLVRLANGFPPGLTFGDTLQARATRLEAWTTWWKANEAKVDLAKLDEHPHYLRYTLVPEMHANKVWEVDADKKVLWETKIDGCPIDAQVLPGGRFLVAELNAHRVTERDQKTGEVLWEYKINTPIACARLPNGHTFIGTNHSLHVVTPDGKEVMAYKPADNFFIHSVQRLRSGHMVCVSMDGAVREVDPTGKEVRTVPLPIRGSWSGIEGVPGGNYLAVNNAEGKVLEVDKTGKVVWEYQKQGACYASRLPNGNTLVISNASGITEVTRDKTEVWNQKIESSLWRAHRR
jgi:hypothetical protein